MAENQTADSAPDGVPFLRTLGGAALERVSGDGTRVLLLGPGKTLGVLAYLECAVGKTTTRERLTDLLWSDLAPDAARHSLRHALWMLRQPLGDTSVVATDGSLHLAAVIDTDRTTFLAACERQDFERAVELYRGDFFPSFAAPGAAEFEQWADGERSHLRYLYLRAVEAVVRDWLSRGRLRKARQLASRVRDSERRDEGVWRLVLECLLAAGDVVAAELEAHQLQEMLDADKRLPEAATLRMLARVRVQAGQRVDDAGEDARPGLVAELVGRERVFSAVLAAWDRARHGKGRHVRLAGAAGLGKSRLLADTQARLRSMGAATVGVRANAGEQRIPYALASELAVTLAALPGSAALSSGSAAALVALNPSLSARYAVASERSAEEDTLRRRVSALEELVAVVADEQPVAVLVDDLHWADAESRQIVQALLPKLGRNRILVVTAERPTGGSVGAEETDSLTLEPLTPQETAALVASLGVLPAAAWAEAFVPALHAAARGSPLLTLETLRLALERDLLALKDGGWECADPAALAGELARGGVLRRRIEQLERHQGWLLLLLALAGAPMPAGQLASAAEADEGSTGRELTSLEVRGLASREGSEWQPGHDEIAAMVLEVAGPDALAAAHRALGRTFVAVAGEDANLLKRAGKHLAAAGDEQGLGEPFERWARIARRRGDRRNLTALAADYLGGAAGGDAPRRLVAVLPVAARARLTGSRTRTAAAGATVLVAAAAGWLLLRPAAPPPDAELLALSRISSDSALVYRVPVRREWIEAGRPIEVARTGTAMPGLSRAAATAFQAGTFVGDPGGKRWAIVRVVGDSGGPELFVVDRGGAERRLTYAPKDDGNADWAPDGKSLVFQTGRWNPSGRTNVAALDLATGRVRRLSSGDDGDASPKWSPDGTRVAFRRMNFLGERASASGQPEESLCWAPAGGGAAHCFVPQPPTSVLLGWYDAHQVLAITSQSAGDSYLVRVDVDTRETRYVTREMTGDFIAGSDGRWIACLCRRRGVAGTAWYVFATDRPDLAARLTVPGSAVSTRVSWQRVGGASGYLDRLEIAAPGAPIPLGGLAQLQARGFDAGRRELAVPVLTWRSSDPAVVAVDSATGEVTARRVGTATLHASAGGWREDSVRLTVAPPAFSSLWSEDWKKGLVEWVPFGDPLPAVAEGPGRRPAFWNNGDRMFYSGAYTRRGFRSPLGIGFEALLSTPVRAFQDQIMAVELARWTDSGSVERWDHRGSLPIPDLSPCSMTYPQTDGRAGMRAVGFSGGGGGRVIDVGTFVAQRPYTLRIQVFPDGSCGFALDGRPLYLSPAAPLGSAPFRLILQGKSVGNTMLVGRLEVWEGIKPGVDWSRVPRSR